MRPELADILDEARETIARGADLDVVALEARIRAASQDDAKQALEQLSRLLAVHRARRSLQTAPPPAPAPKPPPRAAYRAKPAIAANMAVRAAKTGDTVTLSWDAATGVTSWEARISERPDARSDYTERETRELDATQIALELTDRPVRVHLLGRNARGRLLRRAVISGLTADNWSSRWQQRASAS